MPMNGFRPIPLPMQNLADIVRQPLAHDDLQGVAQRDEPALTAHRTHLADVIHIHDRVAVNSLELLFLEPICDHSQSLGSQEPLL